MLKAIFFLILILPSLLFGRSNEEIYLDYLEEINSTPYPICFPKELQNLADEGMDSLLENAEGFVVFEVTQSIRIQSIIYELLDEKKNKSSGSKS